MANPSVLFGPLLALYLLVGCACAVLAVTRGGLAHVADAALLLLFWPLYGPFFLMRRQLDDLPVDKEAAFLAAIRRASGTPLGRLLPDGATARALARRLRTAARKVQELDALLRRPDFSEAQAAARLAELEQAQSSPAALASAGMRLHNIRRLRALRDRFARELDEVGELVAQLTAQAEVLRLDHGPDANGAELVTELLSRVEGLDQIIDDGGSAAHAGAT